MIWKKANRMLPVFWWLIITQTYTLIFSGEKPTYVSDNSLSRAWLVCRVSPISESSEKISKCWRKIQIANNRTKIKHLTSCRTVSQQFSQFNQLGLWSHARDCSQKSDKVTQAIHVCFSLHSKHKYLWAFFTWKIYFPVSSILHRFLAPRQSIKFDGGIGDFRYKNRDAVAYWKQCDRSNFKIGFRVSSFVNVQWPHWQCSPPLPPTTALTHFGAARCNWLEKVSGQIPTNS